MRSQKLLSILFLFLCAFFLHKETKQKVSLDNQENSKTEMVLLSESSNEITIQISVSDFYFENVQTKKGLFSRLTFEDGKSTIELGEPQLPVFRKIIELPYNANPKVEIISNTVEEFNITGKGMDKIYPVQHPLSKTPEEKTFEYDEALYKMDQYYPEKIFNITNLGLMRKHNLYQITVFPIQYNPVQAKLKVYTDITFKINFDDAESSTTESEIRKYQSKQFNKAAGSVSFNKEFQTSENLLKTTATIGGSFLIICHDNFYSTIQSFISHKESLGYEVIVVKKSDIPDQTNNGIRNYIINAYNN